MMFTGKTYDALKFIAQIALPALATLYFSLAGLWNLPGADQVVGTIVAVDLFLGTLLQLSSTAYSKSDKRFDGTMEVHPAGSGKMVQLEFTDDEQVVDLTEKNEVVFKVKKAG